MKFIPTIKKIRDIKLEGQRVRLRRLKLSDAEFILQSARDKEITKYTFVIPAYFGVEGVKKFIKRTHKEWRGKKAYEFGIELKENKELIGTIKLSNINYKNRNADVGFWLSRKYWGKGLVKEALDLILNLGFKRLKLKRIQARILHKMSVLKNY